MTAAKRTDSASKIIEASPDVIYQAFLDPGAVRQWRPPAGMKCTICHFEPKEGGTYRMAFEYKNARHDVSGKTSEHADVFTGTFAKLVPGERIVEKVDFETDDPDFSGTMTITTELQLVTNGTEVRFIATDVPKGINPGDHYKGMMSSLEQLAAFLENKKSI